MASIIASRRTSAKEEDMMSLMTPLRNLPEQEEWVKEGELEKQVVVSNIFWRNRRCCLTSEFFAFTRVGSQDILEFIPLQDIEACDTPQSLVNKKRGSADAAACGLSTQLEVGGGKLFDTRNIFGDGHGTSDMSTTIFQIRTVMDGYNSGRTYSFRASTPTEAKEWVTAINATKIAGRGGSVRHNPYQVAQDVARRIMALKVVRWTMEGAIVLNFVLSVVSTQALPEENSTLYNWLEIADWIFLVLFTGELILNILAQGFVLFWYSGWNIMDAVIVAVSLISKTLDEVPNLSVLRLVRVFRVVRLFQRLRALRSIIESLRSAVLPVLHAFSLLLLVSSIYAVIGVHLYKDRNQPQFGSFAAALFTMFQVCTGDGWATTVVRPMFGSTGTEHPDPWVSLFFVSYILIVGTFLINVVVAVLLDEFLSAMDRRKREYAQAAETAILEAASRQSAGALDPLLVTFSGFNTAQDLSNRIRKVYQVLDADDSGGLNYSEMKAGMRRLRTEKPVHLSAEDWDVMTEGQSLCDEEGELSGENFEIAMRRQMKLFVQRHMAIRMSQAELHDPTSASILFVMKQMMLTLNEVEDFIAPESTSEALTPHLTHSGTFNERAASAFSHTAGQDGTPRAKKMSRPVRVRSSRVSDGTQKLGSKVEEIGGKLDALVDALRTVLGPTAAEKLIVTAKPAIAADDDDDGRASDSQGQSFRSERLHVNGKKDGKSRGEEAESEGAEGEMAWTEVPDISAAQADPTAPRRRNADGGRGKEGGAASTVRDNGGVGVGAGVGGVGGREGGEGGGGGGGLSGQRSQMPQPSPRLAVSVSSDLGFAENGWFKPQAPGAATKAEAAEAVLSSEAEETAGAVGRVMDKLEGLFAESGGVQDEADSEEPQRHGGAASKSKWKEAASTSWSERNTGHVPPGHNENNERPDMPTPDVLEVPSRRQASMFSNPLAGLKDSPLGNFFGGGGGGQTRQGGRDFAGSELMPSVGGDDHVTHLMGHRAARMGNI